MFKKENNKSSSSKFKKWRKLQEKRRLKHEKAQYSITLEYQPDEQLIGYGNTCALQSGC